MNFFNERFVSETESNDTVKNVFSIFGYVALGMFVTVILVWAYTLTESNQYMFISILSCLVLIYCIVIISVTVVNKAVFDGISYSVVFGFTIFMMFLTFSLAIFFLLKYFNIFSSSSSRSRNAYDF